MTLTTAQMPSHSHAKGTLATASAGGHTHDLKNQKTSWGTSGGNRVLIDATSGYTAVSNKTTTYTYSFRFNSSRRKRQCSQQLTAIYNLLYVETNSLIVIV